MAMGNRPEVKTAPAPIVALDVSLLAGHFATALARVPFRHPFAGESSPLSNLGITVTREVIRSFMGYSSSLRIPEFRSLELVLDDICKRIMPPDRALARRRGPRRRIRWRTRDPLRPAPPDARRSRALPARRRLHRHVAHDVRLLHRAGVPADRLRRLRRRLPPGPRVSRTPPAPRTPRPSSRRCSARASPANASSWPATQAAADWPTPCCSRTPRRIDPVRPAGLLLFSPEVDLRLDEDSITENADHDILPWNIPTTAYLHGLDVTSSLVSPLNADLSGFPPDVRHLGRRRDVPRSDPSLCRAPPRGRSAHRRQRSSRACSTSSRS